MKPALVQPLPFRRDRSPGLTLYFLRHRSGDKHRLRIGGDQVQIAVHWITPAVRPHPGDFAEIVRVDAVQGRDVLSASGVEMGVVLRNTRAAVSTPASSVIVMNGRLGIGDAFGAAAAESAPVRPRRPPGGGGGGASLSQCIVELDVGAGHVLDLVLHVAVDRPRRRSR